MKSLDQLKGPGLKELMQQREMYLRKMAINRLHPVDPPIPGTPNESRDDSSTAPTEDFQTSIGISGPDPT